MSLRVPPEFLSRINQLALELGQVRGKPLDLPDLKRILLLRGMQDAEAAPKGTPERARLLRDLLALGGITIEPPVAEPPAPPAGRRGKGHVDTVRLKKRGIS